MVTTFNPNRLSIEFISGGEGNRFAEIMNDFSATIHQLGPIGKGEEITEDALKLKLEAATKLTPYIKLLERERFKVQFKTKEEYDEFFGSDEFNRLFDETIGEKLATSQILLLLKERPRSTGEISEVLEMSPSEVSRQMKSSSRQGLVRYDEGLKSYALA